MEAPVVSIQSTSNGQMLLKKIAVIIRKNEKQIIRGESKLSLDTLSLACLNHYFAIHYEGLGTSSTNHNALAKSHVKEVEFLFQLIQKTPIMKLVHGTTTLQGTVDISRFIGLTELEIKKVPVHLLSGLKELRHQLKVLSCTRCINSLQEVFGNSRDDNSIPPEHWPCLHTLDLSFNHIETLSELMECFPSLRSLDLSHNSLVSVDQYLKWLPKLMYLNMSYNRLKSIPDLSIQGKRCLISLVVRNNNLDNLDGVEELDALEELEVSHNCIHDDRCLDVLSQLNHLALVNLQGNPFSYKMYFRANVIQSMSPKAVARCPIIDDIPITKDERKLIKKKVGKHPLQKYRHSANILEDSLECSFSASLNDTNTSINGSPNLLVKPKENKSKKSRKVRTPTISNASQKPVKSKDKEKLSQVETVNEYRSEIDKMRQRHGSDWLIAVQNIKTDESSTDEGISTKKKNNGKLENKIRKKKDSSEAESNENQTEQVKRQRKLTFNEGEELCGPLLVRVEDVITGGLKHIFLTVRGTFIQEKDLDGETIDQLDLRALKSISQGNETALDENTNQYLIIPCVYLTFDYNRKDRQRREYLIDDVSDSKVLLEALEPMLEHNQSSIIIRDRMQCLKCSLEFNQADANKAVQKKKKDEIESVSEILVCPKCASDLLVELDAMQWEDQKVSSAASTPFGSITSFNSALPLATSSPWKESESTDHPFVRSLDSASTDFHTPDSSRPSSPAPNSMIPTNHSSTSTIMQTNSDAQLDRTDGTEVLLEKECAPLERQLKEDMCKHNVSLPKQELPEYPHEKIEELIENNKKQKFDQHYCLVPQDILGSNTSSQQSSRSNSMNEVPSNLENLPDNSRPLLNHSDKVCHNVHINRSLFGREDFTVGRNSVDSDIMVLNHNGHTADIDSGCTVENGTKSGLVKALNSDKQWNSDHSEELEASTSSGNTPYGSLLESFTNVGPFISDSENDSAKIIRTTGASISSKCNQPVGNVSVEATAFGTPVNSSPSGGELGGLSDYLSGTESQINNGYSTGGNSDAISVGDELSNLATKTQEDESAIGVDDVDSSFTFVDHKLKLYFSMNLFGDVEEFSCMLKGPIFQLNKLIEFPGLLVVSTSTIFIMKVTQKESDIPSDWLFKKSQHPIKDLRHLHVGLGSQCIQLEFSTEASVYTIQIKDKSRCEQFIQCLLDVVESSPNSKRFAGISRDDTITSFNLLEAIHSSDANESIDEDSTMRTYIIGSLRTYKTIKKVFQAVEERCSIAVTSNEICLLDENYFWPLNPNNNIPPKMTQFTVKQLELISNISGIVLYKDSETDISIGFFNEGTGKESYWHLQTETKSSLRAIVSALEEPWEKMFGVKLQSTEHPSIIVQEDM